MYSDIYPSDCFIDRHRIPRQLRRFICAAFWAGIYGGRGNFITAAAAPKDARKDDTNRPSNVSERAGADCTF